MSINIKSQIFNMMICELELPIPTDKNFALTYSILEILIFEYFIKTHQHFSTFTSK